MHLHPAIFPSVVDLARRHGAAAVRVPRDDIRLAIRAGGFHPRWVGWWASLGPLGWWGRRRGGPAARVVDRVYGLYRSGAIDSGYLLAVLSRPGRSEVYLHPSTADRIPLGPNPGDLEALTDREVRAALDGLGGPATFAGLAA